jgi:hypothetical protein
MVGADLGRTAKCLFCEKDLDASTKPEHVLLNALGGRKTTTRAICSDCNNLFGGGIDKALTAQVEVIRNLLQMQTGTRKDPPTLKGVQTDTEKIRVGGDGTIELEGRPFEGEKLGDGSYKVQITARSLEHANSLLPNIAAAIGMPEADVRKQIAQATASEVERRPGVVPFSLSFGGHDAIRSAAKACLVLWSTVVGNDEIRGAAYSDARSFVTKGDTAFLEARTDLDSRLLPNAGEIQVRYGPLFNAVLVRSDSAGRVIGHFTLCNMIGFQIVLAESGGTTDRAVGLVSNPLEPSSWSDNFAGEFDVPFTWLSAPAYDYTLGEAKARVENVMRTYFDIFRPKEIERIIDDAFARRGFGENDPVPPQMQDEIRREISERVGKHFLGLPHEVPLSREELQRAFRT